MLRVVHNMVTVEHRSADLLTPRRLRSQNAVVGVDGGGTSTRAVVMDEGCNVLGEGAAGPSNPLRVGVANAAAAIREAIDRACVAAQVRRPDIMAAEVGLAGARRKELRARMEDALRDLELGEVEVVSDADIALFGATDGEPGLVVIAGTGSVCCGIRALKAIAYAADGRGPETSLTAAARSYFHVTSADDLSTAIYAPTMSNERIAGVGKAVIEAAKAKDQVAREIMAEAGTELGTAAVAVIRNLKMGRERFQVAYVGGVFGAGDLVLEPLCAEVHRVAPKAYLAPPRHPPAVAAARMAREHLNRIALAV